MKDSEKIAAKKREIELKDIQTVVSTPEGRRFYWRVMAMAGVFHLSYTGDTNSTMYNEGRREIGLKIFNDLFEASPNAFNQMQREVSSRENMDRNEVEEQIEEKTVLSR